MIETLIYKTLKGINYIAENAAIYDGSPAVFWQQLPHDKHEKWKSLMYPRIVYDVNWRYNPERQTDGSMTVDIFCTNETMAPEQFAEHIISEMSGLFLSDESGTYCLWWDGTNSFDMEGTEPLMCGVSIAFDIVFYPKQEGETPCPVWSINQFIKSKFPQCAVVGHDDISTFLRARKESPIVYVRQTDTKNIKTNYAMAWQQADMNISVISDDVENTKMWVNRLVREFSIEKETVMQNGSPYLIMDIMNSAANEPAKTGQIILSGQYGVMRGTNECIKLNNAYFEKQ